MLHEVTDRNVSLNSGQGADLTKLGFWLVAIFLGYGLYSRVASDFISKYVSEASNRTPSQFLNLSGLVYLSTGLFLFFELMVMLLAYRPAEIFKSPGTFLKRRFRPKDLIIALGGGFVAFLPVIPFLDTSWEIAFVSLIFTPAHMIGLRGGVTILFMGVVLPLVIEIVFRGIAQPALGKHMNHRAAILVSAIVSANLWPVFGFPFAFLLGLISGWLSHWRGNLIVALLTSLVMTLSAIAFVIRFNWY